MLGYHFMVQRTISHATIALDGFHIRKEFSRDVTDGSEDSAFRIGTWGAGTEYANTLISTSGKVGVGLSDPSARLTVKGFAGSTGLTFATEDASSNQTFFIQIIIVFLIQS